MFRSWKAQTEPFVLDEEQSRAFLDEKVKVYKQTRVDITKGSSQMGFTPIKRMKRIDFL